MSHLIELVFEGLTPSQASDLLSKLGGGGARKHFEIGLENLSGGVVEMDVGRLAISNETTLAGVHLRLLGYDQGVLDVEINFELGDVEGKQGVEFQKEFHDFAKSIADTIGAICFFAGLEPAQDENSRLFTGKDFGPVNLRNRWHHHKS